MMQLSEFVPIASLFTTAAVLFLSYYFSTRRLSLPPPSVEQDENILSTKEFRKQLAKSKKTSSSLRNVETNSSRPLVVSLFDPECLQLSVAGGKASSLALVARDCYPVAEAICITRFVYDDHVEDLTTQLSQLEEMLADHHELLNIAQKQGSNHNKFENKFKTLLTQIRESIISKPLIESVVHDIKLFLDSLPEGATVAVRSSSLVEDGAVRSYAGQFATFLNVPRNVESVELAIKKSFASCFEAHAINSEFAPKDVHMAVLVQRQIHSVSAGVVFTGNPATKNPNELVIEGVWGQGHGVVSGEITPARFIVQLKTGAVVSVTKQQQTHKYGLIEEDIDLVPLDTEEKDQICLSHDSVSELILFAKAIHEDRGNTPQDIEFCLEANNNKLVVYIMQVRPCSSTFSVNLKWEPPGPGPWEQDPGHFPRSLSAFFESYFPSALANGFQQSFKRYGILLDFIEVKTVNKIWYQRSRAVGAPPSATGPPPYFIFKLLTMFHPQLKERLIASTKAAETKLWRQDLANWDDELKPATIHRNRELQAVELNELDDQQLYNHFEQCYTHLVEMTRLRFFLTPAALVPLGDFLAHAHDFLAEAGQPWVPYEVLSLLTGGVGVLRGVAAEKHEQIFEAFTHDDAAQRLLFNIQEPASGKLRRFLNWRGKVEAAVKEYIYDYGAGMRIIEGYDIDCKTGFENPDILISSFQYLMKKSETQPNNAVESNFNKFVSKLPEARRAQFTELFDEASKMNRLREERSLFTDLWAAGIVRHVYLEAAHRLIKRNQLPQVELIFESSPINEFRQLLFNEPNKPSISELQERRIWRLTVSATDGPKTLGPPSKPPPPVEWIPVASRRMERAMRFALHNIWTARRPELAVDNPNALRGDGGSPGHVVGRAIVLQKPNGLDKIKRGDILVTISVTTAFNLVLPLLSGVVTDAGGILSHAAIVARELFIPAVIGTRSGTSKINTGDIIEVDGSTGLVTILLRSPRQSLQRLSSFADPKVPRFLNKFTLQTQETTQHQDYEVPMYVLKPNEIPANIETYTQVNQRWASRLASIPRYRLNDKWLMEAFSLTPEQLEAQRALFKKHDVKKQNILDAHALLEFFAHMGQTRSLNDVNLIFKEWDVDGDGLCTFAEWATVVNQLPSRLSVNLYLGNMYNAQNTSIIESLRITHIVNCAPSRAKSLFRDRGIKYLEVNIEDDDKTDIVQHVHTVTDFINEANIQPKSCILVHCTMGMSRSASLLIGYFILTRKWTLSEALFYVKACRRFISPNQSFLQQLVTVANYQSTEQEHLSQTLLRQSMFQETFRINDHVLGPFKKMFDRLAGGQSTIGVQDIINFDEHVLGVRRVSDDAFIKEHNATMRIKHWDILGNCYVTLPELVATLKGLPCQFLPNIFVGSNFVATDYDMLKDLNVTHIIDSSLQPNRVFETIVTIHVPLDDSVVLEGAEVHAKMKEAFDCIDEVLLSKDKVMLITDPIGTVKCCVVCTCYLMNRRKWTLAQANYYVISRVKGFLVSGYYGLFQTMANYALFLNPLDTIPETGIFLYADDS